MNSLQLFTILEGINKRSNSLDILIYVMLGIITLSIIIILILFFLKKGFFNKERRKIGVIKMRELYEEPSSVHSDDEFLLDIENDLKDQKDEETKDKITDIKEYLKSSGFNTNYHELDENEKNQIMLKLMYLKDNSLISLDRYYEETQELWKE